MCQGLLRILFVLALATSPLSASDTFYVGNSLVNHYLPWVVQRLDPAQANAYKVALINGAGLRYQWENHARTNNGVDAWIELPRGTYDRLVLTESVPLTSAFKWNKPALHARRFAELALPVEPDLRLYLYGTWPHLTNTSNHPWTQPTWSQEIDGDRLMMEAIANQVESELQLNHSIVIVPAAQALRRLRDELTAGTVPGLNRFEDLFTDSIHLSPLGHYYVGLVFYSSLTGQDPRGLTGFIPGIWGGTYINVPTTLKTRLQELVWSTVSQFPRSGVGMDTDQDGDGVPDRTDACPDSELHGELAFNQCQSGVANRELGQGCFLADRFEACIETNTTREQFLDCAESQIEALLANGLITGSEAETLASCILDWGLPNPTDDQYTLSGTGQFHLPSPGLLANDQDPRSLPLHVALDQPPQSGHLFLDSTGGFTFTPDPNQTGRVTFTYFCRNSEAERVARVELYLDSHSDSDGDGIEDEHDVCPYSPSTPTVIINGCNSGAPNIDGEDGCNLADEIAACANGAPPRWAFVQCVTQTVNASVASGGLTRSQADAVMACAQQYDLPTAMPDSYSMQRGTTLYIAAPGLLANDFDLENEPMETHLHQAPSQGTLQLARNGSFRYTPPAQFTGQISFVYRCWDGSGYRTAPVTLTIQ